MNTLSIFSEVIVQISPAITVVAVLIALWQIILAKNALVISSKREAVVLAADKCKEAAEILIPINTELHKKKFLSGRWTLKDTKFCRSSLIAPQGMEWFEQLLKANPQSGFSEVLDFANKVESFSMYFANGAADERVAYPAFGVTFCQFVEHIAPLIVWHREKFPYYSNTIRLYELWGCRTAKKSICKEISDLEAKRRDLTDEEIRPIGT